jgi:hypothetical protein
MIDDVTANTSSRTYVPRSELLLQDDNTVARGNGGKVISGGGILN